MDLSIRLSAANWLYEHSPAEFISNRNNAVLIYGNSELADAFFEYIFTTAFMPGIALSLIRVCEQSDKKLEEFINRNPGGLECFARTDLSPDSLQSSLEVRFCEPNSGWQEYQYAYAVVPKGIDFVRADCCCSCLEDIPCLTSEGSSWSAADEKSVPVLKIARRVHTAYTLGWNRRYRNEDIDRDLYGALTADPLDDYCLRSSLRLAVSLPWKMKLAGAGTADELLQKLQDKKAVIEGHSIKEYLAWQEHHSWQAFMVFNGWESPTDDQLKEYLFKHGNDHRCKKATPKLHPCLCDLLEDDWFLPGKRSLKNCIPSEWSRLYTENLSEFTLLDQISLKIHHECKEIVRKEEYKEAIQTLFDKLEHELYIYDLQHVGSLFEQLRSIEKLFSRLLNNETNSYHSFEQSCRLFARNVVANNGGIKENSEPVLKALDDLLQTAQAAVERNKYRDYKEIDTNIINWIPWIMAELDTDVIWKLYSEDNGIANLASSILLRPEKLVLISMNSPVNEKTLQAYKEVLTQHGLDNIEIEARTVSEFSNGELPIEKSVMDKNVIDVGQSSDPLVYSIVIPEGIKVVYYLDGDVKDSINSPKCVGYYPQQIEITIDEALQISGATIISREEGNDLLGMEEDYLSLWKLCTEMKGSGRWHEAISALQTAESAIRRSIFRKKIQTENIPEAYEYTLPEESYSTLIKNGGIRTLYDLQRRNAVSDLEIMNNGSERTISLKFYPFEDKGNLDYSDSHQTIKTIIENNSEDSAFSMDVSYTALNKPLGVYDLNSPIEIMTRNKRALNVINSLSDKGFLNRVNENANQYTYKSPAIRHALAEEGFPLEAYVYYTLFLSGKFDDVRGNVRILTKDDPYNPQEKEIDVFVIKDSVTALISCKDTAMNKPENKQHIYELKQQAASYGIKTKPILVCSHYNNETKPLNQDIVDLCSWIGVSLIGYDMLDPAQPERNQRMLVNKVLRILKNQER